MNAALQPTAADYVRVFERERLERYPVIDAIEARTGFAIERDRLEAAARVLACPIKDHPPSWQHGRVLYSVARQYLASKRELVTLLDIGTAKGFSALCLQWALTDSDALGAVVSVDVLNPDDRVRRNTVAEVDGLKTLHETLAPWSEATAITFLRSTGLDWLTRHPARVHLCFVDGKHSGAIVHQEGQLLGVRQEPGDIVIFDDLQIPGVALAVKELRALYDVEVIKLNFERTYGIGVRRG